MKYSLNLETIKRAVLCVSVAVIWNETQSLVANENLSPPVVVSQWEQLDNFWKSGKTDDYYTHAAKYAKQIVASNSVTEAMQLMESQAGKRFVANDSYLEILSETEKLALCVLHSPDTSASDRQKKAELLAAYLGRIRSERIQNFQPLSVVANVNPPDGIPGFSGMDPNAILDPMVKLKYLQAIEESRRNNVTNKWQSILFSINGNLTAPVLKYIARVSKANNVPTAVTDKWMTSARFTDNEREEVRMNATTNVTTKSP